MPILEWNGKALYGSDAIARMLAKMYGLAGQDLYEQAQADSIVGVISDVSKATIQYILYVFGYSKADELTIVRKKGFINLFYLILGTKFRI